MAQWPNGFRPNDSTLDRDVLCSNPTDAASKLWQLRLHHVVLSRPQVDLAPLRQRILAPCQLLRVIVPQLPSCLCSDVISTCMCLRLREQCLPSKITSVARVEIVLLLRFVAGNVDVNTLASKRSELLGNADILRMRRVIHNNSTCVCLRIPVAAITQKRKNASVDLWPA